MKIAAIVAAVALAASSASAANTVIWKQFRNDGTVGQGAVKSLQPGQCAVLQFPDATNESDFLWLGSVVFSANFDGAGGSLIGLYTCNAKDVATCEPYRWDADGDGVKENNELDGVSEMKRGLERAAMAGWLYADPSTIATGADLIVCALVL